jgi:hypothetical protein
VKNESFCSENLAMAVLDGDSLRVMESVELMNNHSKYTFAKERHGKSRTHNELA